MLRLLVVMRGISLRVGLRPAGVDGGGPCGDRVGGSASSWCGHPQEHGDGKDGKADCQDGIEGGVDSRFHWAASIHRLSSPARMRGRFPVGLTV